MNNGYNIGDIVRVVNGGKTHPTYEDFFKENNIECYKPYWAYNKVAKHVTPHMVLYRDSTCFTLPIYVLLNIYDNQIYLVNDDGIDDYILKFNSFNSYNGVLKAIVRSYMFILSKFDSNFVIRLPKGERYREQ